MYTYSCIIMCKHTSHASHVWIKIWHVAQWTTLADYSFVAT